MTLSNRLMASPAFSAVRVIRGLRGHLLPDEPPVRAGIVYAGLGLRLVDGVGQGGDDGCASATCSSSVPSRSSCASPIFAVSCLSTACAFAWAAVHAPLHVGRGVGVAARAAAPAPQPPRTATAIPMFRLRWLRPRREEPASSSVAASETPRRTSVSCRTAVGPRSSRGRAAACILLIVAAMLPCIHP